MQNVPVVNEIGKVFSEDLPGLSPDREIELQNLLQGGASFEGPIPTNSSQDNGISYAMAGNAKEGNDKTKCVTARCTSTICEEKGQQHKVAPRLPRAE